MKLPIGVFLTLLATGPLIAQERIQVTGSRIKQIDIEGATPLITFDKEDLERAGAQSISEVLQGLSSNSFGSRRESYGGQQSGSATINLRGVGSSRTLVLINGRRISGDPQSGAVDLNMIPIRAIEKVEVLKAGASAIYGSDALGGVVNIILKKGFQGNAVGIRGYNPAKPGGAGSNHYFLTGSDSKKYQFLSLVQLRRGHALYNKDRDYFRDRRSNGGSPASFRGLGKSDGTDTPWQTSGCDPALLDARGDNQKCLYWIDRDKTRFPDLDHLSMLTSINYQLSTETEFFAQFYASRKKIFWYWFPTYDQRNITVPADSVRDRLPEGADIGDASQVEILTSMIELGRDERRITSQAMGVQAGFRGDIGIFSWEIGASTDQVFKVQKGSNQAYLDQLRQAVIDDTFDPFSEPGARVKNPQAFEKVRADAFLEQDSWTSFYDATISGPLFQLPAGEAEFAAGVSHAAFQYKETQDQALRTQNIWGTFGGTDGRGERFVTSTYFEALLPATADLNMTIAARSDQYSDYGDSNTPAIALRYAPLEWLAIRASGTMGFKAPTLNEMNRAPTLQYVYPFSDAVTGNRESMYILQAGNRDIKEETSTSYNMGVIVAPTSNLKFSFDFWSLKIDDVIGYPNLEDVTQEEAAGQPIEQYGVKVHRDPTSQEITLVESTYMNLGKKRSAGIDLGFTYRLRLGKARLGFDSQHSIMNQYEESGFPTKDPTDRIGTRGKPRIRNATGINYSNQGFYAGLSGKYIGPQKRLSDPRSEYKTFHLTLSQDFASDTKLTLGVKNFTDTTPPADDHYLYDLVGRTYWAGVEQIF